MPAILKICILYVVNFIVFTILRIKRFADTVDEMDDFSIGNIFKGQYILPFSTGFGSIILLIIALIIIEVYFGKFL